ncbi:hypothetical protein [Streptomyces virginiae]
MQTRHGSLVQDRFPDLVAGALQLPEGLVLDGELVVWDAAASQLSFEALQRRAAARGRTATALAAKSPAFRLRRPADRRHRALGPATPSAADALRSSSPPAH